MKTNIPLRPRPAHHLGVWASLGALLLLGGAAHLQAGSADWNLNPGDGNWNNDSNWSPASAPNGSGDIATFDGSNITNIFLSQDTEVSRIVFNDGASAYTITADPAFTLTISGAGITNNDTTGANVQNFATTGDTNGNTGTIQFTDNASAGGLTVFTNSNGGRTIFNDSVTAPGNATADEANILNSGSAIGSGVQGGETDFNSGSDAGFSSITNFAGGSFGQTYFRDNSSAAESNIDNEGGTAAGQFGGVTQFSGNSTAGNATLHADSGTNGGRGGVIDFREQSTGGTSRIGVFGNGEFTIRLHNLPGGPGDSVTIGTLEGDGLVTLGGHNLTIGAGNLSSAFSGLIQVGPEDPGAIGSLTKIGLGRLQLASMNTYNGGTFINGGSLEALHDGALGTGNVSLTAGNVILTLQLGVTNDYIADTASLSIVSGSTVNLNFNATPDTIGSLLVDGVAQAPGLYGSIGSGAPNQLPELFGTGELLVVPEPSTWAMMGLGALLLCAGQRYRRSTGRSL